MKNLLLVSIAFPPKNDPECLQTGKYFKYLVKSGIFEINVLTSANPTLNMPADQELKTVATGMNQLIEVELFENRYINYFLRKIHPFWLEQPDAKRSFPSQWKNTVSKIKRSPDVIYSRSNPISSAIMALKLKQHYQVPWIMHLSDPWVDNPLHQFSKKGKIYHSKLEKECFNVADIITLTSEKAIEFYKRKYPEYSGKLLFTPNVFDDEDTGAPHKFQNTIKFVYTGGLVGSRTPKTILNALSRINDENPDLLNNVEFIFAGQLDRLNKPLFSECKLTCVKHIGLISYKKALEIQKTADILMVIDSPISNTDEAIFFPSKILDYMVARRKIMAITGKDSSSYEVIEKERIGVCFDHEDTTGVIQYIKEAITAFNEKSPAFFLVNGDFHQYAASFNVQKLINKIKHL